MADDTPQLTANDRDAARWIVSHLRPHRSNVVKFLVYAVLDLLFSLALPLSTKYLYDDIIATRDYGRLWVWLLVVFTIFIVVCIASYRRLIAAGKIADLVLHDLRWSAFKRLQRLSLRFYSHANTGDLLSRFISDMNVVHSVIGQSLPDLIMQALSFVLIASVMLYLNWILALVILLAGLPLSVIIYLSSNQSVREASREMQDRIGDMTTSLQENIAAQLVIKIFSLEARSIDKFRQQLGRVNESSARLLRLGSRLSSSTAMVSMGLRGIVMVLGALLVMKGRMTVGELVAFVALIWQVLTPVMTVTIQYQRLASSTGAINRIQDLLSEIPDVDDQPGTPELPPLEREIRVEHLVFSYEERGRPILNDITLRIRAGSRVAVVGPSGSGKSTFIALLLRLFDDYEGRITLDGREIRDGTVESLRQQIAVVPQDTHLFNISIRENIAVGKEDATEAEIIKAAQSAALHEIIVGTKAGYQTVVGERGVRLSGGQRQRLAIARALLRTPRIIIFDEATSSLDPATEADIMQTIDKVGRESTKILITHRLSSVVNCDNIFVLERGQIVEQGTHTELMRARGLYRQLFEEQTSYRIPPVQTDGWVELSKLRRVPLFASLDDGALDLLSGRMMAENYIAGESVVRQGDYGDRLYMINNGEVEVLLDGPRGQKRVNTLGPGDYFGEMAILGDGLRTATVRTMTPTEVYSLVQTEFISLLEREPEIKKSIMETVAERRSAIIKERQQS